MTTVRTVGRGRAGRSFAGALRAVGAEVLELSGRDPAVRDAARGVDAVLLAVPDRAVASVAASIDPVASTVVMHCSGSLDLDVLAPHGRVASIHPLATLPDSVIGAVRLRTGGYFVVDGDPFAADVALALGGHPLVLAPGGRARYHAAAAIAANHLVALLGQVERVASTVGLPLEAFLPLARGALDDVGMLGARAALTGPAARGDAATIERHLQALDASERGAYLTGVDLARRLLAADEDESARDESAQGATGLRRRASGVGPRAALSAKAQASSAAVWNS